MLRRRLHEDAGGEDAVAKSEREVSLFDMAHNFLQIRKWQHEVRLS